MMKHTVNISKPYPAILHITVACWATVMFILSPSCSNKDENLAKSISKEDTIATMETLGVTTYISDSGLIRYKIVAEKWDVFDKKNPPYWAFERGIYLEKFDTLFHIDANIKADTAYYFNRKKLWELRSNVHLQNLQGDKFDTQLLFWDEEKQKIYSNKYIRIERADQSEISGQYGFESNQQLTEYTIYNNSGIFTVSNAANDSTQTSESAAETNVENAPDSLNIRPSSMARPSIRKNYDDKLRPPVDTIRTNPSQQPKRE